MRLKILYSGIINTEIDKLCKAWYNIIIQNLATTKILKIYKLFSRGVVDTL